MTLAAICAGSALLLMIVALALAVGVRRIRKSTLPDTGPEAFVTIIVAAHNEAQQIPALFAGLRAQSYPHPSMHLIIANDRSTDATRSICEEADLAGIGRSIIDISSVPKGVSPKKHALAQAIAAAETEFLLFTDADCVPEARWVESMVRALHAHDVIIGASPVEAQSTAMAARYAAYESHRTMLFMMGAAGLGLPYMAVGRNWAYRKSAYASVGGLEPLFAILSGDDDLLLQRFATKGLRIAALLEPNSTTTTRAPETWRALFRQKRRHYSAAGKYPPAAMLALGGVQFLEWACFVSAIVGILVTETVWKPIFLCIPILLAATWLFAFQSANGSQWTRTAALYEGVHLLFSTIAGLTGLAKSRTW